MSPTLPDRAGFLPLLFFLAWASAGEPETRERWIAAYRLAAVPAALVLLAAARAPAPTDRVVLGTNAYLLLGGALADAPDHSWRVPHRSFDGLLTVEEPSAPPVPWTAILDRSGARRGYRGPLKHFEAKIDLRVSGAESEGSAEK
jgi:hypothetical protein